MHVHARRGAHLRDRSRAARRSPGRGRRRAAASAPRGTRGRPRTITLDDDEQDAQPPAAGLAAAPRCGARGCAGRSRRASAVGHRSDGRCLRRRPGVGSSAKPTSCSSGSSRTPVAASTRRCTSSHEREHVVGARARLGDEEVGVLLRDDRAADAQALAARGVDEPARGVAGRIGEHRARVLPAGLVLAAPAHDLVDAAAARPRGRRRSRRTRPRARRRAAPSAERR